MLYNHFTEELLGLQGIKITNVEQEENLIIHLKMERKRHNCICCGKPIADSDRNIFLCKADCVHFVI